MRFNNTSRKKQATLIKDGQRELISWVGNHLQSGAVRSLREIPPQYSGGWPYASHLNQTLRIFSGTQYNTVDARRSERHHLPSICW